MKRWLWLLAAGAWAQETTFVIRNATIHPVTSPSVAGSSLLVKDGLIAEMGPKVTAAKNVKVIEAKGLHVYPGMIDSATALGLTEITSVRETVDSAELGEFNPQLRPIVAVNPSSEHIPVARANGITAAIVLPAGGIVPGQAGLMHLDGWTWEEMAISRSAAMHLRFPALGPAATRFGGGEAGRTFAQTRRQHEESLKRLAAFFEDARRYQKAKAASGTGWKVDLKLEAIQPVLEGRLPVMILAARERTIRKAIDFAERERVKLILAGCREFGAQLERVKEKKIPVILSETLALPVDEDAAYDSQFTLPAELHRAGVLFAFGTFNSSAVRNLPYQAAAAVGFGLPQEEALKAVTIHAARIWGVDDKTGSVEKGKWADLILTDGDPLETRTQVRQMWIRGRSVSLESRHTRLYEKYMGRP